MLTNDKTSDECFDSPPRKRRAAAVAAQKNWQMIEEEDQINLDDDIIVVNKPKTYSKVNENKTNNITISPRISNNTLSTLKKISIPQTIVIDMTPKAARQKPRTDGTVDNSDCDYNPYQDLSHKKVIKKPTIVTSYRKTVNSMTSTPIVTNNITINNINNSRSVNRNVNIYSNRNQTPVNRNNSAEIICIDTEQTRIIKRTTANSNYRKPPIPKLHPNEPLVIPIIDEKVEEIVGTYNEGEEQSDCRQSDEPTDNLEMQVFSIVDDNDDGIETNEEKVNGKVDKAVQQNRYSLSFSNKDKNYKDSHLDRIIGTLEMECENFDDEFTDNICFDCEEDILSEKQWSEAIDSKKRYDSYVNVVKSTKNVKFLPESEVEDPVGIVTTTVSETTRTVTIPTTTRASVRIRPQNVQLSQSVNRPIPSTVSRVNILSHPRPQRMTSMPTIQNPSLNTPMNGTHLLLPVSSGISTPLLLTSGSQNVMTSNMASIPAGVQVILSQGPQNQTFIMYPKTNSSTLPANTILTTNSINLTANTGNDMTLPSNIYLQNQNSLLHQNLVTTNSPNSSTVYNTQSQVRLRNPQRIRGPTPISATQPQYLRILRTPGTISSRPTTQSTRLPSLNTYGSSSTTQNGSNIRNSVPSTNQPLLRNALNSDSSKKSDNTNTNNSYLFDCLTSIKGNQSKKVNMRTILTIKPLPFSWPSNIDDLISSLIKLDNALMKERFKESPITWMVNAQLICPPKCNVCHKGLCNQVNRTQNGRNEYWMCSNNRCNAQYAIERPIIFSGPQFDIPVSKLLFIIYYWSIQVDVEDLIKTGQIEMGTDVIYNIWQKLQKVCALALQTKDSKLGSTTKTVEVASVQIGRFYVIGAMESGSHRCKLTAISLSNIVQQNGKEFFLMPIGKWVEKGTHIKTCEQKFMSLRDMGYRVSLISKSEFLCTAGNLSLTNIGGYLIHHLQRLFKDLDVSTLTYDILSNVLEELLWRERYGTNPYSAFYNIIKHIAEQCGTRKSEYSATNIQVPIRVSNPTPNRSVGRPPNAAQNQQITDPNSIFVDEYYYSSLKLKTSYAKKSANESETAKESIQCHLCQMFFDNTLIIKHLLEHLEKERRGRVRKGDNNEMECKHCLRFFSNRSLHMHDELTNLKLIPYSCRICSLPFYARHPFILHMKTSHFSGEMPYYCDICSYRSSFQKNLFDHFEAVHSGIDSVMCPYCIRIFNMCKFKNLSQFVYRHLTTHYAVASVYDCDKCVLTFTTKGDLREHCFKGHNPSNSIDQKFEIEPYVVQQEDISLCVRALEKELFTPNLPSFAYTESLASPEMQAPENDDQVDCSLEVSCDPFSTDFTIEPEVQINITNTSVENLILPTDTNYTSEQLERMLSKSFKTSDKLVPNRKVIILANNQTTNCYECKSYVDTEHFSKKIACTKCNYMTHCKKAYAQHMTGVHSVPSQKSKRYCSVLRSFSSLNSYNIICQRCDFATKDGNKMALHMIRSNHLFPLCKPLTQPLV